MCGSQVSQARLQAAGILNGLPRRLKGDTWVVIAEDLAKLSKKDFEAAIIAFEEFRYDMDREAQVPEPRHSLPRPRRQRRARR